MTRKTVIITGASSGIGAACVRSFDEAGYNIIASGRDADRTNIAVKGIDNARVWIGDLAEPASTPLLVDFALKKFTQIDAIINSAGIIYRANAEDTTDQMWAETLAINVTAIFNLSRAVIPHLRKTKGCIINIASEWGLRGGKNAMAYCASKGAVVQMTRAMALDHAHEGIRINSICPGDVDTPMITSEIKQQGLDLDKALEQCHVESPTGRMTRADEIASMGVYLASDAARQITGASISIDGGNTA